MELVWRFLKGLFWGLDRWWGFRNVLKGNCLGKLGEVGCNEFGMREIEDLWVTGEGS